MFGIGLKKRIKLLENRLNIILSDNEDNTCFEKRIEKIILIGDDEEILELIDQFSELNHFSLTSYYNLHKHLDKLDEYVLVGGIARLRGLEEELDSSIHLTPAATVLVIFITAYVALSQSTNSIGMAFLALFASCCFIAIVFKWSNKNRKGRKRIVYFRHLLEYQLSNKITKK
ncbi:hypothetical protein [Cytobacillus purgationiresistens]|uniref:Uncharacterized protein n=1 Tax=Cytobacillus purgationiresistens TaxID=863449 RepID=A0ABU0AE09_9BACI|nr:hypothetical protein [Cytobacillus purgationiresistens]MDQ0268683.1 hypothetical protein [Cytobacillus purgationiresistens]